MAVTLTVASLILSDGVLPFSSSLQTKLLQQQAKTDSQTQPHNGAEEDENSHVFTMQRLGLCVQNNKKPATLCPLLSTAILATFLHNFLLTWASQIVSGEPTAAMRVRQAARCDMEEVRMVWSTLEVSHIVLDVKGHTCWTGCLVAWLVLSGGEVLIKDICIHKHSH